MPVSLDEIIAKLPKEQQERIETRTAELLAEDHARGELRKARKSSHTRLAKSLGIEQERVASLEQQTDLHLASLRRAIEARGGKLTIAADFPNGATVSFSGLSEIASWEPDEDATAPKRRPARPAKTPRAARVPTGTPIALQS